MRKQRKREAYEKKETDTYYYKLMPVTLSRAVYAWFHGEVPEGLIVDHIDNKHDTHYDNRLENLQLKTPAENLAKERPVCRTEIPCDMTKSVEYYIDNYNYWTLEYQREKEERSRYHCAERVGCRWDRSLPAQDSKQYRMEEQK